MRRHLVALLAVWVAGCTVAPVPVPVPDGDATIYVVGRGWHTDIGLAVDDPIGKLATLQQDFPGVRFMVFGFGERNYYMARETGSADMLAALLPGPSAILMTALRAPPPEAFADETVVALRVPRAGVARIAGLIWDAIEKAPDGSPVRLGEGPYPGSRFYAGTETYDLLYTCNTWTARILQQGGIPISPAGVLFASQVMQPLTWVAAMQAEAR